MVEIVQKEHNNNKTNSIVSSLNDISTHFYIESEMLVISYEVILVEFLLPHCLHDIVSIASDNSLTFPINFEKFCQINFNLCLMDGTMNLEKLLVY